MNSEWETPRTDAELARTETEREAPPVLSRMINLARQLESELQAKSEELEREQEGRRQDGLTWSAHCADLLERAEEAERRLAAVEAETIERCASLVDVWLAPIGIAEAAAMKKSLASAIRALSGGEGKPLTPAAQAIPREPTQTMCKVGARVIAGNAADAGADWGTVKNIWQAMFDAAQGGK